MPLGSRSQSQGREGHRVSIACGPRRSTSISSRRGRRRCAASLPFASSTAAATPRPPRTARSSPVPAATTSLAVRRQPASHRHTARATPSTRCTPKQDRPLVDGAEDPPTAPPLSPVVGSAAAVVAVVARSLSSPSSNVATTTRSTPASSSGPDLPVFVTVRGSVSELLLTACCALAAEPDLLRFRPSSALGRSRQDAGAAARGAASPGAGGASPCESHSAAACSVESPAVFE
mmetsp:Transcript_18723/g.47041  ORF Transcript_18723/g.47041 Transcript_18723/m.47041 type:complete len:233 (-) Transcript_18723:505-1203(-)